MPANTPTLPDGRRRLSIDDYIKGVISGDRAKLAQAITLVESRQPETSGTSTRGSAAIDAKHRQICAGWHFRRPWRG